MSHLTAVKKIFQYLKSTVNLGLLYKSEPSQLIGYADSDLAGNYDDRKSRSGYVFLNGGAAVSWYSGKQGSVSCSTANAEYLALGTAAREALYLKQLYKEIGVDLKAVRIYEDNQAAIAIAKNPVFHCKQKHIDVQYHFIRDEIEKGRIDVQYCESKKMTADIFTKALPRDQFQVLRQKLGLKPMDLVSVPC